MLKITWDATKNRDFMLMKLAVVVVMAVAVVADEVGCVAITISLFLAKKKVVVVNGLRGILKKSKQQK